jgi:DNA-binding NarL/FixJ family response regulator
MAAAEVTVALVEDEPLTRERLERALAQAATDAPVRLLWSVSTAAEAIDRLNAQPPAVLLVDLGLPDASGLTVIARAREHAPATEVMVVTLFGDEAHMMRAFEAGARGYLLKDGTEADLAQHVRQLHAGGSPMSPLIARRMLERMAPPSAASSAAPAAQAGEQPPALSEREREILNQLARGYTYAEVGERLGIAASTVQTHVKNLYTKLSVHSKAEAIYEARILGILH